MLSYQHIYHAGNLADVHKHGLLAWVLAYLTQKDKPLSYIETHAGRGLYDLQDPAAVKTAEAAEGIAKADGFFDAAHPFSSVLAQVRATHGPTAYPGSPWIAAHLLRPQDSLHVAELHPGEFDALRHTMSPYPVQCHRRDGFDLAHSLCPPTPRRGMLLIDPSYEVKEDYADIPRHIAKIARAWNVGIICLWYPILKSARHRPMLATLMRDHPQAFRHEVAFAPAKKDHGMIGSGMFIINAPYGFDREAARLGACYG